MKTTRYHILLALADQPLHGAEIQRRVEDQSEGTVTLYPAMLYGTLDELGDLGWIDEVEPEGGAQARWRFYALTAVGRRALEGETARLETLVRRARARLEAAPEG